MRDEGGLSAAFRAIDISKRLGSAGANRTHSIPHKRPFSYTRECFFHRAITSRRYEWPRFHDVERTCPPVHVYARNLYIKPLARFFPPIFTQLPSLSRFTYFRPKLSYMLANQRAFSFRYLLAFHRRHHPPLFKNIILRASQRKSFFLFMLSFPFFYPLVFFILFIVCYLYFRFFIVTDLLYIWYALAVYLDLVYWTLMIFIFLQLSSVSLETTIIEFYYPILFYLNRIKYRVTSAFAFYGVNPTLYLRGYFYNIITRT